VVYTVKDGNGNRVKESGNLSDARRAARRKGGYVEDDKGRVVWPKEAK